MARGRIGAVHNSINSRAVWQALHRPGHHVYEYVADLSDETKDIATQLSPVDNPLNAETRGGVVGRYKAGWRDGPSGSNQHVSRRRVWNEVSYADIVERGKPYVRRRQVFSWVHAKAWATHKTTGARVLLPRPGGMVSTKVVHAWGYGLSTAPRQGHRVLERALKYVAASHGHRRGFDVKVNH